MSRFFIDPENVWGDQEFDPSAPTVGTFLNYNSSSNVRSVIPSDLDLIGTAIDARTRPVFRNTAPATRFDNNEFGYIVTRVDSNPGGTNAVPIFNARVRLDSYKNTPRSTFENIVRECLNKAYVAVLLKAGGVGAAGGARVANRDLDYCQIRLLAGDLGLSFDLTSSLLPVSQVVDDFVNAYLLMIQSATNKTIDTIDTIFEFQYTFVIHGPSSRAPAVTVANAPDAIRANRLKATSNLERRFNADMVRERFIRQNARPGRAAFSGPVATYSQARHEEDLAIRRSVYAQTVVNPRKQALERAIALAASAQPEVPASQGRQLKRRPNRVPGTAKYEVTAAQREQYNATRREKRLKAQNERTLQGNGNVRGVYDDLKRKIFHHNSLSQFFLCSKAVLEVPTTWSEGFCLIMAFMRSEMRTYSFSEEHIEIVESKPQDFVSNFDKCEYITCPVLASFRHALVDKTASYLSSNEIVLFNPYKKVSSNGNTLKYQNELSDAEVQLWYQSAQNVHEYVCSRVGDYTLDPNHEDTYQHYANVFEVYICVYRMEVQGKRTNIYKPDQHVRDLREQERVKVVSILLQGSHAIGITSLRELLRTKASANRSGVYNYCLFCEKLSTANNETIEEARTHIRKCIERNRGCISCEGDTKMREKQLSRITPDLFIHNKKRDCYCCKLCSEPIIGGLDAQMSHVCYIKKPDELKIGQQENIYVYDLECAQVLDPSNHVYVHVVNLVCVRRAYPDEDGDCDRHLFHTIEEFMEYVLAQNQQSRVYLAHNGSKYDVQFVLRYLESNLISHSFIPTPSSMHAYLSVTVNFGAKVSSTFIDFRHFMPGSLKNIGISFGLSVAKGDFPHHFNNGDNEFYIGPLPQIDHADDYWCLSSKRKQEDIDEFNTWYMEQEQLYCCCNGEVCTCDKKQWDFQEELIKYCWLDVDVLAEACVKYRDNALLFGVEEESNEGWLSKGIDPFQYLTIPQLALNLLLAGSPEEEQITITIPKNRRDRCQLAIAWMVRKSIELGEEIQHIGNNHREYFCPRTKRFLDGITNSKKVFVCLHCEFHGCKSCYNEEVETGKDHPYRPGAYNNVNDDTRKFIRDLLSFYGPTNTFIVWECDLMYYSPLEKELGNIMNERDMFYGGRTEVFSPYANVGKYPDDEIKYHDVCSLYPYVCAFRELPTGHPIHYFYSEIDRQRLLDINHPDRYFGFVRCRVLPNTTDTIGLLPHRDETSGRLEFPLCEMTGSWGTEELRLAIQHGYQILDIYEVYHWSKEERSDTLLRGYVSFFLRMKQESEGWKKLGATSESPLPEEQKFVQEKVFQESGCIARIRPDKVGKNPVRRQMAKLFLNSLWGKFCQKPHSENYVVIHGYQQFADLWYNPNLDRSKFSFRHISGHTWKVKYCTFDEFTKPNSKYNIYLSSKVTEWARCILHTQMKKIGDERILYCDTDSLMFLWPKTSPKLDGVGLGNWVDEYPDKTINRLFALAPKFYYLEFSEEGDNLLKSKGIQMTLANNLLIHSVSLGKQILELFFPKEDKDGNKKAFEGYIPMQNMLMGINSTNASLAYGTMVTKYTEDKKLGPVFSKRMFVCYPLPNVEYTIETLHEIARVYTVPKGYYKSAEEFALEKYEYLFA